MSILEKYRTEIRYLNKKSFLNLELYRLNKLTIDEKTKDSIKNSTNRFGEDRIRITIERLPTSRLLKSKAKLP